MVCSHYVRRLQQQQYEQQQYEQQRRQQKQQYEQQQYEQQQYQQQVAPTNEAEVELVERAQDPFRAVRFVLYGIFSLVGLAGVGIAVSQGEIGDAAINAAVLAGGPVVRPRASGAVQGW